MPPVSRYFATARREVLPHLPAPCRRVLDLGCGTGATVAAIRETSPLDWAGGVELDPDAAAAAERELDKVWQTDLEQTPLEAEIAPGSLDLVLCLDILEHLVDPWAVVRRVSPLLGTGGRLVVSVPNIRNLKFVLRLLFKGDFRYTDAGLLDRTHLRFFTRETAIELALAGGLGFVGCQSATRYSALDTRKLLIQLSGGRLETLLAKQFLVVAEQAGAPMAAEAAGRIPASGAEVAA